MYISRTVCYVLYSFPMSNSAYVSHICVHFMESVESGSHDINGLNFNEVKDLISHIYYVDTVIISYIFSIELTLHYIFFVTSSIFKCLYNMACIPFCV